MQVICASMQTDNHASRHETSRNLSDVVYRVYLRRNAAVDAQKLLVHESGQRQAVERVHALSVELVGVLCTTCHTVQFTHNDIRHTTQTCLGYQESRPTTSFMYHMEPP